MPATLRPGVVRARAAAASWGQLPRGSDRLWNARLRARDHERATGDTPYTTSGGS